MKVWERGHKEVGKAAQAPLIVDGPKAVGCGYDRSAVPAVCSLTPYSLTASLENGA